MKKIHEQTKVCGDINQRSDTLENSLPTSPNPIVSPFLWLLWLRVQLASNCGWGRQLTSYTWLPRCVILSGMPHLPPPEYPSLKFFHAQQWWGNILTERTSFFPWLSDFLILGNVFNKRYNFHKPSLISLISLGIILSQ